MPVYKTDPEAIDELNGNDEPLEAKIGEDGRIWIRTGRTEPQTVDCPCGTTFEVNVVNGLICPGCGSGSDDRAENEVQTDGSGEEDNEEGDSYV